MYYYRKGNNEILDLSILMQNDRSIKLLTVIMWYLF